MWVVKNTKNINPRVSNTNNGKFMISPKCATCGSANKVLLAGDKFMPEMYLKQPRFTYSVCEPFTENKDTIQKFKETGDTNYIYKNELDKACF